MNKDVRGGVTARCSDVPAPSRLVLSTFSGAGLLDRGFSREGFCVTSAGDAQFGQPIQEFNAVPGVWAGVIGGPPCQRFSTANRTTRDASAGLELIAEFFRVVGQALPDFFVLENVNGLPDVSALVPLGYSLQRLHLNPRDLGFAQHRPRWFLFGFARGEPLVIPYVTPRSRDDAGVSRCAMASEGRRAGKREWADFCELQGLPRTFDFPKGLSTALRYRLVGNGVHVGVASIVARAILERPQGNLTLKTPPTRRLCVCECGREVPASRIHATVSCRKRMERRRDATSPKVRGPVTGELALA